MKNTFERSVVFKDTLVNAVMAMCAAICIIFFLSPQPVSNANIEMVKYLDKFEYKMASFRLDTDLESMFTPNTKQLFLYLLVKNESNINSEMVWSRIIKKDDIKKINQVLTTNYFFKAYDGKLTFELRANIFPFVGFLRDKHLKTFEYQKNY